MALLDILIYPDPRLHKMAKPIEKVDDEIRKLIDDMAETMYAAPGIGLAAPQVNCLKRVIVVDTSENKDSLRAFVNPQIIASEGSEESEEGCLSVPDIYALVSRAEKIRVQALDRNGDSFELDADDMLAVCIQHEIDHLDGKVFVDYLSRMKQDRIRKKLNKVMRHSS
jgi:peptide deformylase